MQSDDVLTYTNADRSVRFAVRGGPFFLRDVDGLSGLSNDLYASAGAGQDGTTLTAMRIQPRIITVDGVIVHDDAAARETLLRIVNPKMPGRLTYSDGRMTKMIDCVVQKAPVISRDRPQLFQMEFYCPFPFWRDTESTSVIIAQWIPMLEFPLVSETDIGFEFGQRSPSLIVDVDNQSTVAIGIRAQFRALSAVSNPSLTNITTGETLKLLIDMQAGDVLDVTTTYMQKKAVMIRNHVESNAFRYVSEDSDWLTLPPGINQIRYNADSGLDWLEVTLYYDNLYLGV
jgi:hypothetical protein